jgi:hypothetical protein
MSNRIKQLIPYHKITLQNAELGAGSCSKLSQLLWNIVIECHLSMGVYDGRESATHYFG